MILHRLLSAITRQERSKLNENFDRIERSYKGVIDTSNDAKKQSNDALGVAKRAESKSDGAVYTAGYAKITADATAQQLEDIIIQSGTSDAEVIAMRTNTHTGESYNTAYQRLDAFELAFNSDSEQRGINILNPPPPFLPAVGDNVTDDTLAIQAILLTGANVYAPTPPVAYKITDTLRLKDGQHYFGSGVSSVHNFSFLDNARDYFLIQSKNARVSDIKITSDAIGDGVNTSAVALREGAVNVKINNVTADDVPGNGFVMELAVDCEMNGIVASKSRRHGIYITACDNPSITDYKVYNNKLEAVVIRGKLDGKIINTVFENGLIDGTHEETIGNWHAIVLAQHPQSSNNVHYEYDDILFDKLLVRNACGIEGYGQLFYDNGEPANTIKIKDVTFDASTNASYGARFKNIKNLIIDNVKVTGSREAAFVFEDIANLKAKNLQAINPIRSGNTNQAGVMVTGTTQAEIDGAYIVDNKTTATMNYGVRTTNTSKGKLKNITVAGAITSKINHTIPANWSYGDGVAIYPFTYSNLAANASSIFALANSGTRHVVTKNSYLHALTGYISQAITVGYCSASLRKNGVEVATLYLDNTVTDKKINFALPQTVEFAAGDVMHLILRSSADWANTTSVIDFTVSLVDK